MAMRGLSKKRYGCTPSLTEVVAPLAAEAAQPRSVGAAAWFPKARFSLHFASVGRFATAHSLHQPFLSPVSSADLLHNAQDVLSMQLWSVHACRRDLAEPKNYVLCQYAVELGPLCFASWPQLVPWRLGTFARCLCNLISGKFASTRTMDPVRPVIRLYRPR